MVTTTMDMQQSKPRRPGPSSRMVLGHPVFAGAFTDAMQAIVDAAQRRSGGAAYFCNAHMAIEEADIAATLEVCGSMVGHVHFADSNRRAIGDGHTAIAPIVEALRSVGYSGYLSAEILPLPDADTAAKNTITSIREALRAS